MKYLAISISIIFYSTLLYSQDNPDTIGSRLVVKEILINNTPLINYEEAFLSMNGKMPVITLDAEHNDLGIEWEVENRIASASDTSYQFAYLMEGFEEGWILTDDTRHYTRYTNLRPGQYVFRLKYAEEQIWEIEPLEFVVIIQPKWYQTWWARLGGLGIIAGLIILI